MADGIAADRGESPRTKKPYVRVMTDKRREQNRRAQKNYREKLKRKLEDLEEQVASTAGLRADEEHLRKEALQQPTPLEAPQISVAGDPNVINVTDIFTAAGDLPLPDGSLVSSLRFPIWESNPRDTPVSTSPTAFPTQSLDHSHSHSDYGSINMIGIWKMPHRPPSKVYAPPDDARSKYKSASLAVPSPTSRSFGIPDPHVNFIKLTSETNLEASLSIAFSLGITRDSYEQDHPSQFPQCFVDLWLAEAMPMVTGTKYGGHAHIAFDALNKGNAPKGFSDHIKSIKPPLRPRPVQLLEAHPSYLDCIVFPRFREKVVQASADGILDHSEFFLDLIHGGLVCWGSKTPGNANSKGGGGRRRRGMQDQVAWSTRSWEARRWFLTKWEWLVGTEEQEEEVGDPDGIWAGSRWWWAARGELDEDETLSDEEEIDRKWAEGDICPLQSLEGSAQFGLDGG